MLSPVQGQPAAVGPGTVLGGDFRLERPLGVGGMGSVYVALQQSTGKQRAVKVMHPSLVTSADMRERFVQEARIGSMIPSDHVVEVVGAGVDAGSGAPWLAMELLSGEDLSQYVARRGRLGAEELVTVMRPVFHALSAAHRQSIVHRDIKPENIFLATTQSSTAAMDVKVLDFGIAKVTAQALGTGTSAMGTPLWMAPEQTEQQAQVSPATDVWALALLVFWSLVGKSYWRTAQTGTGSVPQLMREVLFEAMVPASQRAAEIAPGLVLPAGFDEWFAKATAREPSARYLDASAAGLDLFNKVLGASASITALSGVTAPSPGSRSSSASWTPGLGSPSGVAPAPATITAVPVTTGQKSNAGKIAIFVGAALALLVVAVVGVVGLGGMLWFGVSDDSSEVAATEPASRAPAVPAPTSESAEPVAPESPEPATDSHNSKPASGGAVTPEREAIAPMARAKPDAGARDAAAPTVKKAAYSAGQKVDVLWGGSWWKGQIVSVKGEKFLVHYIGWGSNWDEWVTTARLRPWTGTARGK